MKKCWIPKKKKDRQGKANTVEPKKLTVVDAWGPAGVFARTWNAYGARYSRETFRKVSAREAPQTWQDKKRNRHYSV